MLIQTSMTNHPKTWLRTSMVRFLFKKHVPLQDMYALPLITTVQESKRDDSAPEDNYMLIKGAALLTAQLQLIRDHCQQLNIFCNCFLFKVCGGACRPR